MLEELPDEKIIEAFESVGGRIGYCPKCGELTAFLVAVGRNGRSECHNCGYEEIVVG